MKAPKRKQKAPAPGSSRRSDDSNTLCINCRGCERFPDSCNRACVICMCEAVLDSGTAEKIRLVSNKDVEITGATAEIICSLARIRRPLISDPSGRKCAKCSRSPSAILGSTWSDFPDPDFKKACSRLYSDSSDGPECIACMQRTFNALSVCERDMDAIRSKTKDACRSRGAWE